LLLDDSADEIMASPDAMRFRYDGVHFREASVSFYAGKLGTGAHVIAYHFARAVSIEVMFKVRTDKTNICDPLRHFAAMSPLACLALQNQASQGIEDPP
jgi:hypothetical protein